jgi:hypothetical protein
MSKPCRKEPTSQAYFLFDVPWRLACMAWQKPDVVKTLKAYKALIFGYISIKEKV